MAGFRQSLIRFAGLLCAFLGAGCAATHDRLAWNPPAIPLRCETPAAPWEQLVADAAYADLGKDPRATDLYFQAAVLAWRQMQSGGWTEIESGDLEPPVVQTYHTALARFLEVSRENGRWSPGKGVLVETAGGPCLIPIQMVGSVWSAAECDAVHAVGCYQSPSLSRHHRRAGFGVPVVVDRHTQGQSRPGDRYLPAHSVFGATVVLRPADPVAGTQNGPAVLELHNSQADGPVLGPAGSTRLAADTSAPFVYRERELNLEPNPFEMFVYPDNHPAFEGLYFLEPYQPGKIPVVFVHGLMSSPRTWIDMANDLRANPEFCARYQIWAFDYATGKPFVRAAAELRRELREATAELSAVCDDPALNEIVLVGHSMGGLISKLQVTHSGTDLWECVARVPLEQVNCSPELRQLAQDVFFFEPLPQVRRVVFVGTPHRGAEVATRLVGRVSSSLVKRSPHELALHFELVTSNPGAFRNVLRRRLPTSIDMLEPHNRMLRAIDRLPVCDSVQIHTIAGTGKATIGAWTGDGVVPRSSARHPLAESELLVRASHTRLHRDPHVVAEVWRILDDHAASMQDSRFSVVSRQGAP